MSAFGGKADSFAYPIECPLIAKSGLLLRLVVQRNFENGRCDLPISGHTVLLHRLGVVQTTVAAFDCHLTPSVWRRITKSSQYIGHDLRDIVLIAVVGKAACPGYGPGGENRAAV